MDLKCSDESCFQNFVLRETPSRTGLIRIFNATIIYKHCCVLLQYAVLIDVHCTYIYKHNITFKLLTENLLFIFVEKYD